MKKTTLFVTLTILALISLTVFHGVSDGKRSKEEKNQLINTRVDNVNYWVEKAQQGIVPFNPDNKPAPARYTGSKIKSRSVLIEDSPDVPVTDINSTQSENSVFVDPNNPEVVLNSNNSTENPVGNLYGANDLYSFSSGETWEGEVQGAGGENRGDPTTAIGHNGKWYVNYINNPGGMGISHSNDQGATWTTSTVAPNPGDLADKNHMWIDNSPLSPYNGQLYVAWTEFGGTNNNEIAVATSADNGITWTPKTAISTAVSAGSHNQGVNLSVGPNGEVYAVWAIYDSWPSDESAIGMSRSLDGGATWEPAVRIIENIRGIRTSGIGKDMRVNSFPTATVDISNGQNSGNIYVTWANIGTPFINTGSDCDVYLISSTNKGLSWSDPLKINQDEGGSGKKHYFPWISSDPSNGALSIVFYDDRNVSSSELEVFCASSSDGGITWEDFKVSDVAFTPMPIPGLAGSYFGDYLGITAQDGWVYPVWTDNRSGTTMTYCSPYQLNPLNKPFNLTAIVTFETGITLLNWSYEQAEGFTHFNIYRNESLIGTTSDTTFSDLLPDYGDYTFKVTAAYSEDRESAAARASVRWGDAHIAVSPLSLYEHLVVDSQSVQTIQVVNTGQLPLHYSIKPLIISKSQKNLTYCAATGGGTDEYISRVQVGEINNPSGQSDYADYTNLSTKMFVGDSYQIIVTNGDPNWEVDQCSAWVDWNQDAEFGEDERIDFEGSPGVGPYNGTIIPPVGATSGVTTMRVRITYNNLPEPCGTTSWGEVEDYSVIVQGWLDLNPVVGDILPGDTTVVEVAFDATDMETGSYFAEAVFYTNDPLFNELSVPIQLDVSEVMVVAGTADSIQIVCSGTEIQLTAQTFGLSENMQYVWSSTPQGFESSEQNPMIQPEVSSWYKVLAFNDSLSAQDSIFIEVIDYPVVNLGADTSMCGDAMIVLDAGNSGSTFVWSTGETTQSIQVDSNAMFHGYGIRNIQVQVTNQNQCASADEIKIDIVNCTAIEENSALELSVHPNPSAGQFKIKLPDFSEKTCLIHVYDLQGKVVYEKNWVSSGSTNEQEVDMTLENAPSGRYILTVYYGDKRTSTQIIIK